MTKTPKKASSRHAGESSSSDSSERSDDNDDDDGRTGAEGKTATAPAPALASVEVTRITAPGEDLRNGQDY